MRLGSGPCAHLLQLLLFLAALVLPLLSLAHPLLSLLLSPFVLLSVGGPMLLPPSFRLVSLALLTLPLPRAFSLFRMFSCLRRRVARSLLQWVAEGLVRVARRKVLALDLLLQAVVDAAGDHVRPVIERGPALLIRQALVR